MKKNPLNLEMLLACRSSDLASWPKPRDEDLRAIFSYLNRNDDRICRQSHPVRYQMTGGPATLHYIYQRHWDVLCRSMSIPRLNESMDTLLKHPFIQHTMNQIMKQSSSKGHDFNAGSARGPMIALHYIAQQGVHVQTTLALNEIMTLSDLREIRIDQLQLPYPSIYLEFGEPEHRGSELLEDMRHPEGHPIEGLYLSEEIYEPGEELNIKNRSELIITREKYPDDRIRMLNVMMTYSPIGRRPLDDNLQMHTIVIPESRYGDTLESIINDSFAAYNQDAMMHTELMPLTSGFQNAMRSAMIHAAKLLLYMGARDARIETCREQQELLESANRRKGAKKRKLLERANRAHDRIIVGPEQWISDVPDGHRTKGEKQPHWRRGHWHTVRFGPGKKQSRLDYFKPVLVRADALSDDRRPAPKSYRVK